MRKKTITKQELRKRKQEADLLKKLTNLRYKGTYDGMPVIMDDEMMKKVDMLLEDFVKPIKP